MINRSLRHVGCSCGAQVNRWAGALRVSCLGTTATLVAVALVAGCWQDTQSTAAGEVRGFSIGASKREVFDAAIRSQQQGTILNLFLIGEPATTAHATYKGFPIVPQDFRRVAMADTWQTNLPGCNCWLRLMFRNDSLVKIEEHEWTGPTK